MSRPSTNRKRVVGRPAVRGPRDNVRHPPRLVVSVYCDECSSRLHLGPTAALKEGVAVLAHCEGWSRVTSSKRWAVFHALCPRCTRAMVGHDTPPF